MLNNYLNNRKGGLAINYCQVLRLTRRLFVCAHAMMAGLVVALLLGMAPVQAQMPPAPGIPNFWDLQRRVEKPNTAFLRLIRFVTDDGYPPFGVTLPDGKLTGFNVDLARAICRELKVTCTVQARRFDTIVDAIETGKADAAIASLAINAKARQRLLFTHPYYRTPARFAAVKNQAPYTISPAGLAGKTIGVVPNTAHFAFLKKFFPKSKPKEYRTTALLLQALKDKQVAMIFGDGVTFAIWLNSVSAADCCEFRSGPYTESYYFGEGVGIAVNKQNVALKQILDFALMRLAEKGTYSELYLKYFPVSFY